MMKASDHSAGSLISSGKRLRHLVALAMSMVLLCAVLLVAFHHHDDGRDHDDDCPVCSVAHHRTAAIATTFPHFNYLPFTFPAYFAILTLTIAVPRFCHSTRNRAPPA